MTNKAIRTRLDFLAIMVSSFLILKILPILIKKTQLKKGRKERLQGLISPWSLYIGSFWRIHFITYSKKLRVG